MKNIFLLTILIIFTLGACKDFLDEEPKLSQSNELTLATFEGLDNSTLGAYVRFCHQGYYGTNLVAWSELRGGNGKNPTAQGFGSNRLVAPYLWSYTFNTAVGIWEQGYYTIAAANNVINNLEGKTSTQVSMQDINNLKAECLFIRALCHFDIVRSYAQPFTYQPDGEGIPVVVETISGNQPPRNTTREVYTQILEDLLEAEEIMADNYVRTGVTDRKAVVTKPAIQALLSRVYLYMGNWQECANYATKVINNSAYTMWTAAEYVDVWGLDAPTGGEVIFEMYGSQTNSHDPYWEGLTWQTKGKPDAYGDLATSQDLLGLFDPLDVRLDVFASHPEAPDHYWTLKYPGKTGGEVEPDASNTVILRLSEMYLNRAEALYRGATISGATALGDLTTITSNRRAPAYTTVDDNILFNERRKELCFEGHIAYDYARLQRSLVRVDYDGSSNQNISFPDYKWAYPIPNAEVGANPNIDQNQGY